MAFFAILEVVLVGKGLAGIPTLDTRAAHSVTFFALPGGTNLGVLEDGAPPGDTKMDAVPMA